MRLGIGTYTYGWAAGTFSNEATDAAVETGFRNLSAQDLIDRAVRLDVPVAQICVLPDLGAMDDAELTALRRHADDKGITLEIGTMGSSAGHLLHYLQIAQVLGAQLVRTIFTEASPGLVEERKNVEQVANEYAAAGIVLAIENYEMTSFLDLQAFVRQMDNEYVGVCLDTVNSLGRGEGLREVTESLMPYTKCLHVKDFKVVRHESNMAFAVVGAPAGEGILDVPAQMGLLQEVYPDASIVLEQWTPYQADFAETVRMEQMWAETSIANMQRWLEQAESS